MFSCVILQFIAFYQIHGWMRLTSLSHCSWVVVCQLPYLWTWVNSMCCYIIWNFIKCKLHLISLPCSLNKLIITKLPRYRREWDRLDLWVYDGPPLRPFFMPSAFFLLSKLKRLILISVFTKCSNRIVRGMQILWWIFCFSKKKKKGIS